MNNELNVGNFLMYTMNMLNERNIKLTINNGVIKSTWDEVPIKDNLIAIHTIIKRGTVLFDEIILARKDLNEINQKILDKINNTSDNINVDFKIIGSFYHTNDNCNINMEYNKDNDLLLVYQSKWLNEKMKPIKVLSLYNILDDIPVVVTEKEAINLFNMDNSYLTDPNNLLLNSSDTERKRTMDNYKK